VTEAKPLWSILASSPKMALTYYAAPLLGLICLGRSLWLRGVSRSALFAGAFLAAAFLVSIWQVRGSMFSIPLAVLPLAAWVAEWRERAKGTVPIATTLKMLATWLLSFTVSWSAAAAGLSSIVDSQVKAEGEAASTPASRCQDSDSYSELAAIPPTNVLAVSNLGASILRHTSHYVLAGPYHRNTDGNLAVLSAFMEPMSEAEKIIRPHHIALVAICPGNDESAALAKWAPQGFMAALRKGDIPAWLEPVAGTTGKSLELYRVRPPG
jgi:hypothetical protein